jgi:hypothetical protein
MPTIHTLFSIKIDVYSRDHSPPHFHALYAEHEIIIEIKTLKTVAGQFPSKQFKQIIEWAKEPEAKKILLENFYRLNPRLRK